MVVFVWPNLLLGIGADLVNLLPVNARLLQKAMISVLNSLMPRSTVEDPKLEQAIQDRVQ